MALEWYSRAEYKRVCGQRDAERDARAREEARALALEAELARVRTEAEQVRAFYEEREAKLKARIGGEMLRAEKAEEDARSWMIQEFLVSQAWLATIQERDAARRDLENALTALEELLAGRA